MNKAIDAIYDDMIWNKYSKLITCSLFVELSKTFDSIDHNILLEKWFCYGVKRTPLNVLVS